MQNRGKRGHAVWAVIPIFKVSSFSAGRQGYHTLWLIKNISDRWKDYLPVGQRMPGTRFIAFKVPLQKSFEEKLAPEERFSPLDLFNKIREQNEELGLIIDLTYTQRYYKPEDLPETIPYLKIFTVGHRVPDDDTILKFKCAVNGFLKENKDNDKLIGVHCTHGLNRTGYLICRYLIDVEGMRPDDAIELFNRCRGHCLERQNYIEDLQNGSIRKKFSQNRDVSQRGYTHPPGPPGEDYSQRRYSWNVKPNARQAAQNKRWYSDSYYRLSYPTYWGWAE
ncbi:PREDICTED: RNA/RNP complex-1-interacting phosphatase isoform X5 [Galeopterus variegatus]|uniref:RNA/RNP complex-1-interacting phosphatase isoform X5 n=1 Tax=Galeopterus variegatus TaxID=482537 RepID=A0ABM0QM12_GALVR|nr:PREDICTED: RNA/RNP complex-1-interacting phosphatase isoform X5 [Galeopterus variegatus]